MTHARIQGGTIAELGIPPVHPTFHAGRWWDCRDSTVRAAYVVAASWLPVVIVTRPADTATNTSELSHALIAGTPTQVWTVRPWTAGELTERTRDANRETLAGKADAAITANDTYLAIGAPTNAQNLAQIRALTRAVTALIRIVLALLLNRADRLDTTNGT